MQGGVRGFFRFALGDEQLIKCIRVVARGEIWLEAELITPVFDEFIKEFMKKKDLLKSLTDLSSAKLDMLSPREMEIMELISQSMTNEEIADKLFLSPKTVKTHLRNIFQKAGIKESGRGRAFVCASYPNIALVVFHASSFFRVTRIFALLLRIKTSQR